MKNHLVLYHAPAAALEKMQDATPEQMKAGMELFAYRGYLHPKKKWWENRVANVAAAFAGGNGDLRARGKGAPSGTRSFRY